MIALRGTPTFKPACGGGSGLRGPAVTLEGYKKFASYFSFSQVSLVDH